MTKERDDDAEQKRKGKRLLATDTETFLACSLSKRATRQVAPHRKRRRREHCALALRGIWSLAWLDLLRWRRMPLAIASALIPPLGMAVLLVVLSLTVTQEPVALVIQSHGPFALQMIELIESDTDSYRLSVTSMPEATRMLHAQAVPAIITIPPDFDQQAIAHAATLQLTLNNVDIDFADDIRRSVERSVGQFDAPQLGLDEETGVRVNSANAPNPYHIAIAEHDLRRTNVDFLNYQVLPVLVLLVLSTGLMGTALLCAQDVERGTARHLVLTPIPAWILVAGRLLGGLLITLVVLVPAVGICVLTALSLRPRTTGPPLPHFSSPRPSARRAWTLFWVRLCVEQEI